MNATVEVELVNFIQHVLGSRIRGQPHGIRIHPDVSPGRGIHLHVDGTRRLEGSSTTRIVAKQGTTFYLEFSKATRSEISIFVSALSNSAIEDHTSS